MKILRLFFVYLINIFSFESYLIWLVGSALDYLRINIFYIYLKRLDK